MITLKKNDPDKPIWTTMNLAGQDFEIELLPLLERDRVSAFSEFMKRKGLVNPISNKMDFVEYMDYKDPRWAKISDDLLDKHVRNFKGIGGNNREELDGTIRENKILLGSVKVEDIEEIEIIDPESKEKAIVPKKRERYFYQLIFDKCTDLANTIAEAETKN
jgi:hypothetical protein